MKALIDFLKLLPTSVQIAVAGLIVGGAAFAGHEIRYMTVADFTKSYVLDLKAEVRELRKELKDEALSPREREMIEEQIESLLDELCYESPDDLYCED